jgi:hypothetical protein
VVYERRIESIVLRNVGLLGEIPVSALAAMVHLKHIDFSSDPSLPFENFVWLPTSATCVDLPICAEILCDFGPLAESCVVTIDPSLQGSGETALTTEVIAGIAAGGGVVFLIALFLVYRRATRRPKPRKRRAPKESPSAPKAVVLHTKPSFKKAVRFEEPKPKRVPLRERQAASSGRGGGAAAQQEEERPKPRRSFSARKSITSTLKKAQALGIYVPGPRNPAPPPLPTAPPVSSAYNQNQANPRTGEFSWANPLFNNNYQDLAPQMKQYPGSPWNQNAQYEQEVYDPATDQSYMVNTATGERRLL